MEIFCTLFNSKYLDKGIALYQSLCNVNKDFKLYIFCFDQLSHSILLKLAYNNIILINIEDIETKDMKIIKKQRSLAEYCWTCTPIVIEYVLKNYNEKRCTYLDADLYFFSSFSILFNEIAENNKSVIITEHRFSPNKIKKGLKESGKYCVQFNTFKNDLNGLKVLEKWKYQCLDWCYYTKSGYRNGDQKYLEDWTTTFEGVHELENLGAGVAPWNFDQYSIINKNNFELIYKNRKVSLIFYHFQNIRYLPFNLVNINSGSSDKKTKEAIYIPYLYHIEKIRKKLKGDFGLEFRNEKSYFSNKILSFIQKYIMPFKVKAISDIVALKTIRRKQ